MSRLLAALRAAFRSTPPAPLATLPVPRGLITQSWHRRPNQP